MSSTTKIKLLPHRLSRFGWRGPDNHDYVMLAQSLPFYRSYMGAYTHRVRSGCIHIWDGEYHHTSLSLWCGMIGSLSKNRPGSKLLAKPEATATLCATCEGRAIGAGQTKSHKIAGHFVKYSPRLCG